MNHLERKKKLEKKCYIDGDTNETASKQYCILYSLFEINSYKCAIYNLCNAYHTGALLLWLSFLYVVITFKDFVQKRSDFVIVPKGQASTSYDQ